MFEASFDVSATSGILFFVLVLTCLILYDRKGYTNLPPGPKPLPFFGNILQLCFKDMQELSHECRERYGNIYSVYKFSQLIIVVNGYEYLRDLFVKNGSKFSRMYRNPHYCIYKGKGVLYAEGDIWKHNRRFILRTLKDFGMAKSRIQVKIHEEISHFLDEIEKYDGQPFDIGNLIDNAVSNVICSMVFGNRFQYTDANFRNILAMISEAARRNLIAFPVWFKYIPGDPFGVAATHRCYNGVQMFHRLKIREHLQTYDKNDVRDVIDAYIKQMTECENKEESRLMNEDELMKVVHDLFQAGTDTTANSLKFALGHLLRNPDIQEKLYYELLNEVPENRLPDVCDKKQLPFLEATLLENLRRSVILSCATPRSADEDLEYRGYTIPKSTFLVPNLESVLSDENLWHNPRIFSPSRFLGDHGCVTNVEEFIPFSIGPRACPGEALARMEMYLFLAAMLQRFQFLPPEGELPPNFSTIPANVNAPKPFKLRAMKRKV